MFQCWLTATMSFCAISREVAISPVIRGCVLRQPGGEFWTAYELKQQRDKIRKKAISFSRSWTSVHWRSHFEWGWRVWPGLGPVDEGDVSGTGFAIRRELRTCRKTVVPVRSHFCVHQCGSCLEPQWSFVEFHKVSVIGQYNFKMFIVVLFSVIIINGMLPRIVSPAIKRMKAYR